MKKPAKFYKKAMEIKPCPEGGFRLIIMAANAALFTFANHSPYWFAKRKMEGMFYEKDEFNKSTYKSILIGRWRWVDSETRKRVGRKYDRKKAN